MTATSAPTHAPADLSVFHHVASSPAAHSDQVLDIVQRAISIARAEQIPCLVKLRTRLLTEFSGMETSVDEAIGFWARHVNRTW